MCTICGDPTAIQHEITLAVTMAQAIASVPIVGIIIWQFKSLIKGIKEIFTGKKTAKQKPRP